MVAYVVIGVLKWCVPQVVRRGAQELRRGFLSQQRESKGNSSNREEKSQADSSVSPAERLFISHQGYS